MDLVGARSEVRDRLAETTADFWSDTEITRALNEALRRFSAAEKWQWLYTSVTGVALNSGTSTLVLQTGIAFHRHFNLLLTPTGAPTSLYVPQRVDPVEGFKLRTMYPTSNAYPQWYYVASVAENAPGLPDAKSEFNYTVKFVPTPSQNFTVEYMYVRYPSILLVDTDELDIPEEYAAAAPAYATFLLWKKELTWERKAQEALAEYLSILDDARKEHRRSPIDENLAWGRNQPEFSGGDDEYARRHISPTLG